MYRVGGEHISFLNDIFAFFVLGVFKVKMFGE